MNKTNHSIYFNICIFLVLGIYNVNLMAEQKIFSQCENRGYYTPNPDELDVAESLFSRIVSLQADTGLIKAFEDINLDVTLKSSDLIDYTLVSEFVEQCRGKGSYAINYNADNRVMIQSPHVFFDTYTGEIAEQLFLTGHIYAAAWNSISRKKKSMNSKDVADLAHNDDSIMMRVSLAFARKEKNARIIQLHGFSRKKRKTPAGRLADVIISSGTKKASAASKKLYLCLKKQFSKKNILHYPYEVKELGATKNTIARRLRTIAFDGFVHMEMSKGFRKTIKTESKKLDKVVQCLAEL